MQYILINHASNGNGMQIGQAISHQVARLDAHHAIVIDMLLQQWCNFFFNRLKISGANTTVAFIDIAQQTLHGTIGHDVIRS